MNEAISRVCFLGCWTPVQWFCVGLKCVNRVIFLSSEKSHFLGVDVFLTSIDLDYPFSARCLLKNSFAFVTLNTNVLVQVEAYEKKQMLYCTLHLNLLFPQTTRTVHLLSS